MRRTRESDALGTRPGAAAGSTTETWAGEAIPANAGSVTTSPSGSFSQKRPHLGQPILRCHHRDVGHSPPTGARGVGASITSETLCPVFTVTG